ncbi:MAG: hypothetical protein LRY74_11085 [Shewanella xiamenensis]|nr:hypothetical protein [Shewanella xiamenensis]
MAKKGFFSWFRKDKSQDEVVEQTPVVTPSQTNQTDALAEQQAEAARLTAEQALADKLAAEKAETEELPQNKPQKPKQKRKPLLKSKLHI